MRHYRIVTIGSLAALLAGSFHKASAQTLYLSGAPRDEIAALEQGDRTASAATAVRNDTWQHPGVVRDGAGGSDDAIDAVMAKQ